MSFKARLALDAVSDIMDILEFVRIRDGQERSDKLASGLEEAVRSLEKLPGRGHTPPELEGLGLEDISEIHFKPYRIIFEIAGSEVTVMVVADGRRDLQDLLTRRTIR